MFKKLSGFVILAMLVNGVIAQDTTQKVTAGRINDKSQLNKPYSFRFRRFI
jgi:hypothetical protein